MRFASPPNGDDALGTCRDDASPGVRTFRKLFRAPVFVLVVPFLIFLVPALIV